jgi:hypothetical protein
MEYIKEILDLIYQASCYRNIIYLVYNLHDLKEIIEIYNEFKL